MRTPLLKRWLSRLQESTSLTSPHNRRSSVTNEQPENRAIWLLVVYGSRRLFTHNHRNHHHMTPSRELTVPVVSLPTCIAPSRKSTLFCYNVGHSWHHQLTPKGLKIILQSSLERLKELRTVTTVTNSYANGNPCTGFH